MSKFYYKKDDPTKVVTIANDSKEAYYELSNGSMIKKDVFSKYYSEMDNVPARINESYSPPKNSTTNLDPDSFFTTPSIQLNQNDIMKLKNADPSKGVVEGADRTEIVINTSNQTRGTKPVINEAARQPLNRPKQNESIVQEVDETTLPIPDHTNTDVSQYRVYENEDDAYDDFVNKGSKPQSTQQPKPKPQPIQLSEAEQMYEDEKVAYGPEEANRRRDIRLKRSGQTVQTQQPNTEEKTKEQSMSNPAEAMFKTFKRNHNIQISVVFNEKIGKPEFIKMMMENMEGDIVGYYKKLIVDDIMNNFKVIEDEVEKQIKEEIFGKPEEQMEAIKSSIETIVKLSKQIVDKSSEITINDGLDDDDTDITTEEDDEFGPVDLTDVEPDYLKLIPGGLTPGGKQLYKYIDEKGKVKEALPKSADKKGWTPLTKEE